MKFDGAIGGLVTFAIGGGWGTEEEKEGFTKVAVIRGTDIPRVEAGDYSTVPYRYESEKKIVNRQLKVGDIVLETAGGSSAKGQFTGRTLLVTEEILENLGSAICASFCKRLVLDKKIVLPEYFYWYMQDLYKSGRVAVYDSQSTGISNFQFKSFMSNEYLTLGPLIEQTRTSNQLKIIQKKNKLQCPNYRNS